MITVLFKREHQVRERKVAKNILEHLSTRLSPGELKCSERAVAGHGSPGSGTIAHGMSKHRRDPKKHAGVSDQANEKENCT
jgi:hypothetical protein